MKSTSYTGLFSEINKLEQNKLYPGDTYLCTDTYETFMCDDKKRWVKTGNVDHSITSLKTNIGQSINAWTDTVNILDYDNIFEEISKRFSIIPTVEHKCHNCGGTLEMKANEHIFKCPYCKSAYAVGTAQINARY